MIMETQSFLCCAAADEKNYDQFILEGIKIACADQLGNYALRHLQVSSHRDLTGDLRRIISTRLLSREIGRKKEVVAFQEYASWWHHFKSSYFPKWLLNCFPIKYITNYVTVTFTQFEGYPKLNIEETKESITIFRIDTGEF